MALIDDFVEVLFDTCTDAGDTAYVDSLLAEARSAIAAGKSTISSLQNSGLNGKNFSRVIHLNSVEVAWACKRALDIYNDEDTAVSSTRADFRNLQR